MNKQKVIGFDWDHGNWPKCGKHGPSKSEIENIFYNSPALFPNITHSGTEERFKAIGKTQEGRSLYVSFTIRQSDEGNLIRPVSARYMHKKEIDHYEKS